MSKFVKKPIVVDAVQFTEAMTLGQEPLPAGVVKRRTGGRPPPPGSGLLVYAVFLVQTPHGERTVCVGDWITTYPSGNIHVCPADALQEAGVTDADALAHLRGEGPHARGCWVLDRILGKG